MLSSEFDFIIFLFSHVGDCWGGGGGAWVVGSGLFPIRSLSDADNPIIFYRFSAIQRRRLFTLFFVTMI